MSKRAEAPHLAAAPADEEPEPGDGGLGNTCACGHVPNNAYSFMWKQDESSAEWACLLLEGGNPK